jgi:uncharacterized protein (TIGR03067 family)
MILAALFLVGADKPKKDAASTDLEKLQGVWSVVGAESNGEKFAVSQLQPSKVIFKGDRMIRTKLGKPFISRIKLDPSKTPRAIDIHVKVDNGEGEKTVRRLGIYELDGDTLKIATTMGKKRPTAFKTRADSDVVLVIYKRAKK